MSAAGLDWQFAAVTLAALWGAWILLRPLLPSRKTGRKTGACASCSSGCEKTSASEPGLVSLGGGKGRGAGLKK